MDTETFLLARHRLELRLDDRRMEALEARVKTEHNGNVVSNAFPFWLRFAFSSFLPKRFGGFWPQALLTAAPMVFGLVKTVTGFGKKPESSNGFLKFFPIVKSLINRYN